MNDRDVRELIRRHDPARGVPPLDAAQRAAMRRSVTQAAAEGASHDRTWRARLIVAGGLAALLIVAAAGMWVQTRVADPTSLPVREATVARAGRASGAGEADAVAARQVQMVTPGGTRVVWILNPDLNL